MPDLLLFLQRAENTPEVVINKDFDFESRLLDKNYYILKAADFLQEDILKYSNKLEILQKNCILPLIIYT